MIERDQQPAITRRWKIEPRLALLAEDQDHFPRLDVDGELVELSPAELEDLSLAITECLEQGEIPE